MTRDRVAVYGALACVVGCGPSVSIESLDGAYRGVGAPHVLVTIEHGRVAFPEPDFSARRDLVLLPTQPALEKSSPALVLGCQRGRGAIGDSMTGRLYRATAPRQVRPGHV